MTAPVAAGFDVAQLDQLLDINRLGAFHEALGARREIRRQFAELVDILTPAVGSPMDVVLAVLAHATDLARNEISDEGHRLAAEIVGALGLFPRFAGEPLDPSEQQL